MSVSRVTRAGTRVAHAQRCGRTRGCWRSVQPERYEIYTATLQKRLPRFRLPLAADDRDTVLDLHTAFNRCYDQGGFAARIDYKREPATRLNDEDRRWVADLLKEAKLR